MLVLLQASFLLFAVLAVGVGVLIAHKKPPLNR